ncbi:acyl-CoA dehydrogenase family protein [Herbaspirillum autotrophicum]|uniref:acyl-CoA dehydrogenase family protein n=1 Tax=Herbaspirillum autotrophicum TaxID=180195 RepID=UPI0009FAF612|nr:acyl-CoA dehydrogenase family protein [Herbaspirillum autotrophicum]
MIHYVPPLRDMQFVLDDMLDAPGVLADFPTHAETDASLMQQVLTEGGRFATEILFPLNASGDHEGCHFDGGAVTTPAGFVAAWKQFCDGGWPALACAPEHGGQGLPQVLNCALFEMLSAANHGWTMYPGLLHGACACLSRHASEELQQRYLPPLVSGEWLATMCLTEAHAGSDLGLLRTRALPQDDGSYAISGSKIFISGGEQDLTDNIVHLVLARLPDAPVGSKGLSLFLVPKYLPDGARNAAYCTGIEEKMGIHGSATCSMQFDGATGWLVGTPQRGLNAMFVMMNSARLHVAAQGLGLADAAYQQALHYARERLQSRAPGQAAPRSNAADAIVMQPAVQRLLMNQRSYIEGGRMLTCWSGLMLDSAESHPDPAVRALMHERLGFITPVLKAMLTTQGFQGASDALQVFGGHGYVTETGIDQYLRDARITMIYEGSNEIQCVDFLLRKILADNGTALEDFLAQVEHTAHAEAGSDLGIHASRLLELTRNLRTSAADIRAQAINSPRLPYLLAPEMLRLTGHAALAWMWLRASRSAAGKLSAEPRFYQNKRDTACYYFTYIFSEVHCLNATIDACLHHARSSSQDTRSAFPSDLTEQDATQEAG